MKPMSESLMDLAARVKELEASAAAARDKNRAALEARRHEIEDAIDREVKEFEATATEATAKARAWWADTRTAIERQVAARRADYEKWRAEHREERAERIAEFAEEDAEAAMALATYCLNAAEWAAVDAALARAEAEDIAPDTED